MDDIIEPIGSSKEMFVNTADLDFIEVTGASPTKSHVAMNRSSLMQEHSERASYALEFIKSMLASGKNVKDSKDLIDKGFELSDLFKDKVNKRFTDDLQVYGLLAANSDES